jgi:uncharacterized delta-60 repeat protein
MKVKLIPTLLIVFLIYIYSVDAYILGSQNNANGIALQNDDSVVITGFTVIKDLRQVLIARYTSNGILDATFGTNGCQITPIGADSLGNAIAIDGSDNLIVAGVALDDNQVSQIVLARYSSAGVLDPSFGTNGITLTSIGQGCTGNTIIIQADGKIVVGGSAVVNGDGWMVMARYDTSGALDSGFGDNGIVIVELEDCGVAYALQQQPDGKLLLAGSAEGQFYIVRYLTDGTVDTSFGDGGGKEIEIGSSSQIKGIGLQSDDKIVVAGYSVGLFALARLNTDGSLDTSFGIESGIERSTFGTYNAGLEMAIDSQDRIVVVGLADDSAIITRYTADGIADTDFGSNGFVSITCGFIANANDVVINTGTDGITIAGFTDNNVLLARILSTGGFDRTFGILGTVVDPSDYFPTCTDILANYIFAYDTTTQEISQVNTYQDVTFNTHGQINGWEHTTSTASFTCKQEGVYLITYNAITQKTSAGASTGSLRAITDNVEIAGSKIIWDYSTANQALTQSKTFIASFNADDVLKLQYAAADGACELVAEVYAGTITPSVSLTITKVL